MAQSKQVRPQGEEKGTEVRPCAWGWGERDPPASPLEGGTLMVFFLPFPCGDTQLREKGGLPLPSGVKSQPMVHRPSARTQLVLELLLAVGWRLQVRRPNLPGCWRPTSSLMSFPICNCSSEPLPGKSLLYPEPLDCLLEIQQKKNQADKHQPDGHLLNKARRRLGEG